MKRFLYIILSAMVLANSCVDVFRDEISELHGEIDSLRALIEKTNSNVEALQTIVSVLQNNDYVTGITPIWKTGLRSVTQSPFPKAG